MRITHIFVIRRNNKKLVRYEFRYNRKNYFVTGNSKFTQNAYLQKSDLRKHRANYIKFLQPTFEYKSKYFTHKSFVKEHKPGTKARVRSIIYIGRKGDYQTRIVLTNGHYITSNKNWIKLI